jgi:hypothetical protein
MLEVEQTNVSVVQKDSRISQLEAVCTFLRPHQ